MKTSRFVQICTKIVLQKIHRNSIKIHFSSLLTLNFALEWVANFAFMSLARKLLIRKNLIVR